MGTEFYSVIDGTFASMIILLSAVKEGIGASFVGAFEDDKVTLINHKPCHIIREQVDQQLEDI
ncbi:MAG: hypothetical protein WA941_04315 [Nitrososphaeraceae archaeon]